VRSVSSTCRSAFTLRVGGEIQKVQALQKGSFTVARRRDRGPDRSPPAAARPRRCASPWGWRPRAAAASRSTAARSRAAAMTAAWCSQHAELLPWLTAMQDVMFGWR